MLKQIQCSVTHPSQGPCEAKPQEQRAEPVIDPFWPISFRRYLIQSFDDSVRGPRQRLICFRPSIQESKQSKPRIPTGHDLPIALRRRAKPPLGIFTGPVQKWIEKHLSHAPGDEVGFLRGEARSKIVMCDGGIGAAVCHAVIKHTAASLVYRCEPCLQFQLRSEPLFRPLGISFLASEHKPIRHCHRLVPGDICLELVGMAGIRAQKLIAGISDPVQKPGFVACPLPHAVQACVAEEQRRPIG